MRQTYLAAFSLLLLSPLPAHNFLSPGSPTLDRPTLTSLGVVLPVTDDDNLNATVSVKYRKQGTAPWLDAQALYRARPETVSHAVIPRHFAGSIVDLRPATTYEIQLRVQDPDNALDQTFSLVAATRALPHATLATPRAVTVRNNSELSAALLGARAGDVITLADGVYSGNSWTLGVTGTAANPVVLRGASLNAILDGANCNFCNLFEVYGPGYVVFENLTFRNGWRALRFQTAGATNNTVRRCRFENVVHGIASQPGQLDFVIADNILEGRLPWPLIGSDDGGTHANDVGISVQGSGHVVAHNRLSGFGDSIRVAHDLGGRATDVYGNEILTAYDNGIELDGMEGNVRCFRNRLTNAYFAISVQPVTVGPAYIFRNVIANAVDEPYKFHGLAIAPPSEPNGVFVYNNSSWMNRYSNRVWTSLASHHFALLNNVFMGPAVPGSGITVDWNAPIDNGRLDYNGYFPDGPFYFNRGGYQGFPNLAAAQAGGFEANGRVLTAATFASSQVGPTSYLATQAPADAALAAGSRALDAGLVIPNINDYYRGTAPDLGAQEQGCPAPVYGPRSAGVDESNQVNGCTTTGSAAFLRTDTQSRGNWRNVYGSRAYTIAGGGSLLAPASPWSFPSASLTMWAANSSSLRALQRPAPATTRVAAAWASPGTLQLDLDIQDAGGRPVALYFLDWVNTPGRTQTVRIFDRTGTLLDQRTVPNAYSGVYLSWRLTGRVRVEVTASAASATISGLFVD